MKTTTVQASDLGDNWLPSAHMVRAVTAARNVEEGDRIRVRQHRRAADGESRTWHTVLVEGIQSSRSEAILMVDKWPVAYVCELDEMVELVEISRTAIFRCVICNRADAQDKQQRTVLLKDFIDAELVKTGGLHVVILESTVAQEITGYCREHGTTFLS